MDAYEAREAAEEGARDAAFASYDADKKQEAFGAAMAVVRAAWASYEAAEEEAFDEVRSESGAVITESHAAYIAAREKASAAFAAYYAVKEEKARDTNIVIDAIRDAFYAADLAAYEATEAAASNGVAA